MRRVVLCNGVFDLLHVAHVRHLEQASKLGELVVGVTRDATVNKLGRPIIPEAERLEMVKSLRFVSDASLCRDSLDALEQWKPKIFCKGHDYVGKGLLSAELDYCARYGIEIFHTDDNPQTTSKIIERIKCASL